MKITKEEFCKVIENVKRVEEFNDSFNKFLRKYEADGYVIFPDAVADAIKLLKILCNDDNKSSVIDYFIFEISFGKKYTDGCYTFCGKKLDISTAEGLYDALVYIENEIRIDEEVKARKEGVSISATTE